MISLSTGLSVSSIVTNIRIGHGGAYSIITKSLGVEAGGAIGIPLYLAQAISVAFYIVGFGECWVYVLPEHSFLAVCLTAWVSILIVSYCSARLAFRIQYGILIAAAISLVSIFLGHSTNFSTPTITMPVFSGNFFRAFSVFFPAVTGFMAGLSMSGELSEPKKSIPRGTLCATIVSVIVYVSLAVWFWKNALSHQLVKPGTGEPEHACQPCDTDDFLRDLHYMVSVHATETFGSWIKPRCRKPASVIVRPFACRSTKPDLTRNGSMTD